VIIISGATSCYLVKKMKKRCFLDTSNVDPDVGREEYVQENGHGESQTALFVCSQITSHVKNLEQKVVGLTAAVQNLQKERPSQTGVSSTTGKGSQSLPEGLSLSFA